MSTYLTILFVFLIINRNNIPPKKNIGLIRYSTKALREKTDLSWYLITTMSFMKTNCDLKQEPL